MRKRNELFWYHPDLVGTAKDLRNNPTQAEVCLWQQLKGKQVLGYDFHRQKPIYYYIVDFYCPELKLAIEVDGTIHNNPDNKYHDDLRQSELVEKGISFLRFSNEQVLYSMDWVVCRIKKWIRLNA